jgi:hypothetical protein
LSSSPIIVVKITRLPIEAGRQLIHGLIKSSGDPVMPLWIIHTKSAPHFCRARVLYFMESVEALLWYQ